MARLDPEVLSQRLDEVRRPARSLPMEFRGSPIRVSVEGSELTVEAVGVGVAGGR